MIVRILGEGQFVIPDEAVAALNVHDGMLTAALDAGDEAGFRTALDELLGAVRTLGSPLPDEELTESHTILPNAEAGLDEVRSLLADDGLIPG